MEGDVTLVADNLGKPRGKLGPLLFIPLFCPFPSLER